MNKYVKYQPFVQLERLSPMSCHTCQFVTYERESLTRHQITSHSQTGCPESIETAVIHCKDTKTGKFVLEFVIFFK